MKTTLTLALTIILTGAIFSFSKAERSVYICNTKNAVAYHLTKECKGLQKCKGTTSQVSESTAKNKGLHLCGFED